MVFVDDRGGDEENDIANHGYGYYDRRVKHIYIVRQPNRDRSEPYRNERAGPMRVRVCAADEHTERQPSGYENEHLKWFSEDEPRRDQQRKYQKRRKRALDTVSVDLLHFRVCAVFNKAVCNFSCETVQAHHLILRKASYSTEEYFGAIGRAVPSRSLVSFAIILST